MRITSEAPLPKIADKAFALALGARMRRARLAKGLHAADVATAIGKTQQMVSRYERGGTVPYADVLCDIAAVVGTTVAHLVGEETNGGNDRRRRPVRIRG